MKGAETMNTFTSVIDRLRESGIQPTHQRIIILDYLIEQKGHPTADEINRCLQQKSPALSKATVYNTLKLFSQKGLIHMIATNQDESRYEIADHPHGHFVCSNCGEIFDIDLKPDSIISEDLEGFIIEDVQLLIKGICPKCEKEEAV